MIRVDELTKDYGPLRALDGVSFDVAEGEILGFLGPNGAGKTTTMRILTGYMPPTSGTVTIGGMDVLTESLAVRKIIGYMPELVPLYPEMSVEDYLAFMASIRGVIDRQKAVDAALEACHVGDVKSRIIGRLSKGYRQRVGLAQALVHDPQVLILDEPTIGLDPRQIMSVRELIKSLGQDRTVILSTHILSEVSQVCDRVMILDRGHIVAEDTTAGLGAMLQGGMRVRMELLKPPADAGDRLSMLAGVDRATSEGNGLYDVVCDPGADPRMELAALAVNQGWGLLGLEAKTASLEEVFLRLTGDQDGTQAQDEGVSDPRTESNDTQQEDVAS